MFFKFGNASSFVRILRIGRLMKLTKLFKLVRLMKMYEDNTMNFLSKIIRCITMSDAASWFLTLLLGFLSIAHLICCTWIIVGRYDDHEDSWIPDFEIVSGGELYMTSFYYTITTMTTVGYGDISAQTFTERVAACIIMFIGVMVFSYASGSLTNAIL